MKIVMLSRYLICCIISKSQGDVAVSYTAIFYIYGSGEPILVIQYRPSLLTGFGSVHTDIIY